MEARTDPIRRELVFGAVCGLGLSAMVWSLTLWPPPASPGTVAGLALASVLGGLGLQLPRAGRVNLGFPVVLGVYLILGAGAAVLVAATTAAVAALLPAPGNRLLPERIGHRVGARAIGALAGATAAMVPGIAGIGHPGVGSLAAFAVAYGIVEAALARLETWAAGRGTLNAPFAWRALLHGIAALALGTVCAAGLAYVYHDATLRPWLLLLPTGVFALLLTGTSPIAARDAPVTRRGYESVTRALTKAIAAHDSDGEDRLWRVRDLCVAVGARLGLRESELQALATAALLHDIGKIAVPEPILTKPGRLSPAEMERVKIHPATGAEILTAIAFPHAICGIVRNHHERWDGRGYPDGLSAEEIPLGARILAAIDCYDAIISNRPYRRALPASEARRHLRHEAGAMFDPDVVDTLLDYLDEQGQLQRFEPRADPVRPTEEAPAAIPRAQRDLERLYAVSRATRYPIDTEESLTLVAASVAAMVPAKCFTVWRLDPAGDGLRIVFASGVGSTRLSGLGVPLDDRPIAWAVRQQRSIVGHDHVAPRSGPRRKHASADLEACLDDPQLRGLSASLIVPIANGGTPFGAIALYDDDERKFTRDDQRLLSGVAGYVARAMVREQRHPDMSRSTLTDPLTGLPNARFLWLEAAQRSTAADPSCGAIGEPYGLIAFRVGKLSDLVTRYGADVAERGLIRIAQRLAGACTALETLVRFGHDLFVVLSPRRDDEPLVARWQHFVDAVEARPLDLPSDDDVRLRLVAAHASYPLDGDDLDALFEVLESRLDDGLEDRRTVVPFRRRAAVTTSPDATVEERG